MTDERNGFIALSVYDRAPHGGNGDSWITQQDAVFASLLLWADTNHDGVSRPGELHSLLSLGVYAIALKYKLSGRRDRHGNVLRFRSKILVSGDSRAQRYAYDVVFR